MSEYDFTIIPALMIAHLILFMVWFIGLEMVVGTAINPGVQAIESLVPPSYGDELSIAMIYFPVSWIPYFTTTWAREVIR